MPGARKAGIAHFIDHQISVPAEEALLQARIFNVRPPFANFYRAAIGAVDRGSEKVTRPQIRAARRRPSSAISSATCARTRSKAGPGRAERSSTRILRTDAVDVVYGTMEGYAALGIPYQAHIVPTRRW